jgi:membrane protein YqaA with SNARE-associated domain
MDDSDVPSAGGRPDSGPATPGEWIHALYPLVLALLFSAAIFVVLARFRTQVRELRAYGYLGAFLIGLLGNATILLPGPSLVFTTAMGGILNPFLIGFAAGSGEALGEITGYLGGISGKRIAENHSGYELVCQYVNRYGGWVFLILAALPNPLFDVAGFVAGVVRYPLWKFLLNVWIGKTLKAVVFANAGNIIL